MPAARSTTPRSLRSTFEASQINFCNGNPDFSLVHDKVVKICPSDQTVTLQLTEGFSFARPVLYLSMDANDRVAATLEGATLAPALKDITVGHDDSAFSAVERIFLFANGPTGKENPQRQGLNSAISDGLSPLKRAGGNPDGGNGLQPSVGSESWRVDARRNRQGLSIQAHA